MTPAGPVAGFSDHFSAHAPDYSAYRPGYPAALFDFLVDQSPGRDRAWDCGCGSGQAARALAERFERVFATDASEPQVRAAPASARVTYVVARAESAPLRSATIALAGVAQALHWFDLTPFYAEVRRVLQPGGVLAAWTYGLVSVSGPVDACIRRLYADLGPWWPPERRHVESGYASLPFPFAPVPAPGFVMTRHWQLEELAGYLGTWSALRRCRAATGADPLAAVRPALARAWGDPREPREVNWALVLRAGRTGPAGDVS